MSATEYLAELPDVRMQLWALAFTALALAVFAGKQLASGKQASARIQKQGSSPFLGHFPMEFGYWILRPLGDLASALRLSPNLFSWGCFGLGDVSGVLAGLGMIAEAGLVSLVSSLFDSLDGMVARKRGVASDAGEVLDAAVDRYTEFFFLAGLVFYFRNHDNGLVIVLICLLGSFMVSYSQAKAEAMQITIPKGWMRRPERALYLGTGAFLSPLFEPVFASIGLPYFLLILAVALVGIFANITAVIRFRALYQALRK